MVRLLIAALSALLVLAAGPARAHEVGDLVFCDMNGNGVFEPPTDAGIPGVTVVRNCGGTITTTVTNAVGRYAFPNSDGSCTYSVDASSGPVAGLAVTTPLPGGPPPPTAEHSPAGGFGCGSCPDAVVNTVVGTGVFQTVVNNPCNCQDPACTGGLDPCFGSAPFVGYFGDDFGFQCSPPTTTSTTTTSTTTTTEPIRDFSCYEVDRATFSASGLPVADRYGAGTVDVIRPKRLCNPADENHQEPGALTRPEHLVGYVIRQASPPFARIAGQQVTNEFGTLTVELVRPDALLVPSAKSLTAPPPPLAHPAVDHFKCYRVAGARQHAAGIQITDEFGTLTIDLDRPERLCVPADLSGEGIPDPTAGLLCYKAETAPGTPAFHGPGRPAFIDDEFQAAPFDVKHLRELCVRSTLGSGGSPSGAFVASPRPPAR